MSVWRERLSLLLTKPYLDALDYLIEEGVFLNRQEGIRDALRISFGAQGISPFYPQEKGWLLTEVGSKPKTIKKGVEAESQ